MRATSPGGTSLGRGRHGGRTLGRVARYFDRLQDTWHMVNLGFERKEAITVHGTRWTCCYKVHANIFNRDVLAPPTLQASITLWPPRATRVSSAAGKARDAKLRRAGWYDACERELRRHGYRGEWRVTEWGRMGDFWKDLKDIGEVAGEVRRFSGLRWEPLPEVNSGR